MYAFILICVYCSIVILLCIGTGTMTALTVKLIWKLIFILVVVLVFASKYILSKFILSTFVEQI